MKTTMWVSGLLSLSLLASGCESRRRQVEVAPVAPATQPGSTNGVDTGSSGGQPTIPVIVPIDPGTGTQPGGVVIAQPDPIGPIPTTTTPGSVPVTDPVVPPPTGGAVTGRIKLNEITFGTPATWKIAQQSSIDGVVLATFNNNAGDYVAVYSRAGTSVSTSALFGTGSAKVVSPEASKKVGSHDWKIVDTSRVLPKGPHAGTHFVTGFVMIRGAFSYYGYANGKSTEAARNAALQILETAE